MAFMINLPPAIGPVVFALITVAITAAIFLMARLIYRGRRTESTRVFAQQMALRIGTMHALVVALVFSVLTGQLIKLHHTSDTEAISAASVYWILKNSEAPEAIALRELIPQYLQIVIEKEWEALSGSPHDLPAWELISRMQSIIVKWRPATAAEELTRKYVFDNINTMAESRDRRVIHRLAPTMPPIFWLIAILGYFLTLAPYLTVEFSKFRFFLVLCYAVIIGVLFYGILVLDNPFSSQVIHPTSFEVTLHEIKAGQ